MAVKKTLSKAEEAARAAQNNQYLQRLMEDEDLRGSLLSAADAARGAFGRLTDGKPPRALLEDKKLQAELKQAASALRDAGGSLREPPKKARGKRGARSLLVLAVAGVLAVALNEGLRSKLLDALFGSEEEFDYSSTTTPETPAPVGV